MQFNFNRGSHSCDEMVISSDEFASDRVKENGNNNFPTIVERCEQERDRYYDEQPQPTTSRRRSEPPHHNERREEPERFDDGQQKIDQLIREAEQAKVRMYETPGRENFHNRMNNKGEIVYSRTDDDYILVSAHVDNNTRNKIVNGEYVDFARLIPRERALEHDGRMELINKGGMTFFVPAHKRETPQISSFVRWEQAFHVFANIYTRQFPQRAPELIEYNFMIHTAALTYLWENVYAYDRDFRMHMSHHPEWSWSLILQQAWSLRLKDKWMGSGGAAGDGNHSGNGGRHRQKDICWRYNKGKCTYGSSCKF